MIVVKKSTERMQRCHSCQGTRNLKVISVISNLTGFEQIVVLCDSCAQELEKRLHREDAYAQKRM
jgi:hypothetical protein